MNNLKKARTDNTVKLFTIIILLCILSCLCSVVISGFQLFYMTNPPETIIENGYTYQLATESEYDPPKNIQRYGQIYALITDTKENDINEQSDLC